MQEKILHAIDLCMLGDLQGAKESAERTDGPVAARLAALITQMQEEQSRREALQKTGRHELGNALSIAQANLEAMIDGVLDVTPQRLHDVRESLRSAGALLVDLRESPLPDDSAEPATQTFDLTQLLAAQIAMMRGAAEPKNVAIAQGDPEALAKSFRDALLAAIRRARPGEKITLKVE
jgi:flagellar biosynthesis/type III secretory pathway protein FliH